MLNLAQETDLLLKISLFTKLSAPKLKSLAFTGELVIYDQDEVLRQQLEQHNSAT